MTNKKNKLIKIFSRGHSDFTVLPYTKRAHEKLKNKSKHYQAWHKNSYSKPVHRGVLFVYILFVIALIWPNPSAQATSITKIWTTQSDFETGTTKTQVDTTSESGSVKLGSPTPSITFKKNLPMGLASPYGIRISSDNKIYAADTANNYIKVFNIDGTYERRFGSAGSGDGQLNTVYAIAFDTSGNVYVADTGNNRIQVFDYEGNFLRKFGTIGSADGQFNSPKDIYVDSNNYVYVADYTNNRVQVFNSSGVFQRKFGSTGSSDGQFNYISGLTLDSAGNIYTVEQSGNRVQKFDNAGNFIMKFGTTGSGDGQLQAPSGIFVDNSGKIYVCELSNDRIQIFQSNGTFIRKFGGYGPTPNMYEDPYKLVVDSSGYVYVTDSNMHRIQVINGETGTFSYSFPPGLGNGQTFYVGGVEKDASDNIYYTSSQSDDVQVVSKNGSFIRRFGAYGSAEGQLVDPGSICMDSSGNVYVLNIQSPYYVSVFSSTGLYLRRFDVLTQSTSMAVGSDGKIYIVSAVLDNMRVYSNAGSLLATIGSLGTGDGQFTNPAGVAADSSGNIYVLDTGNSRVQVFDSSYNFVRKFGSQGTGDGYLSSPYGIELDSDNNVYVSDTSNNRLQVFNSSGVYQRKYGSSGVTDGKLSSPSRVLVFNSNKNILIWSGTTNRFDVLNNLASYYQTGSISGGDFKVDSTGNAHWQSLSWNATTINSDTYVSFRVRTSNDNLNWSFFETFEDATAPYSVDLNGLGSSRYMDIEVNLVGDFETPTLQDVTLDYVLNNPPTVSSVSASQISADSNKSKVEISYNVSDTDNDTADLSFFFSRSNKSLTTLTSTDSVIYTDSTAYAPNSGAVLVDNEIITYSSKADNAYLGLTRGAEGTRATSHGSGADLAIRCSTVTGGGSKATGAGNNYTAYWDVKTDLPDIRLNGFTITVAANDGNLAYMVGTGTSGPVTIDTLAPIEGSFSFQGKSRTNNPVLSALISATDDSGLEMMVSDQIDFSGASWQTLSSPTTFEVADTEEDKVLYAKIRDIYGNEASQTLNDSIYLDKTLPSTPSGTYLRDNSDPGTNRYELNYIWDPVGDVDFSKYSIERSIDNQSSFSEIATFSGIGSNSYIDRGLDSTKTYYYRMRVQDIAGNWSAYSDIINMSPSGQDQTPPNVTGNPSASPGVTDAVISWLTDEAGISLVEFGKTTNYGHIQGEIDMVLSHSVEIIGLEAKTLYHYRVRTRDVAGNESVSDDYNFSTTADPAESTTPVISETIAVNMGKNPEEVIISWSTDKASTSQVLYGVAETTTQVTTGETSLNKSHTVYLKDLLPNTKYFYRVVSVDEYGNKTTGTLKDFTTGDLAVETGTINNIVQNKTTQDQFISENNESQNCPICNEVDVNTIIKEDVSIIETIISAFTKTISFFSLILVWFM